MKVKARDLIAGWPRGRSTSVLSIDPTDGLFWFRAHNRLIGKLPPHYLPATRDRLQYIARVVDELIQEIDYRAGQHRMVDEYLERWRLNVKCHACGKRFYSAEVDTCSCPKCGQFLFCQIALG